MVGRSFSLFSAGCGGGGGGGGGEREGPTCQDMSRTGEAPSPQGPCWYLLAHPNRLRPPPPPVTPPLRLGTSRVPPPPTPPSSAPAFFSSPLTLCLYLQPPPRKCTKLCWKNKKQNYNTTSIAHFLFLFCFSSMSTKWDLIGGRRSSTICHS